MNNKLERLHECTAELSALLERKAELYRKLDRGYTLLALFPLARSPFYIYKTRDAKQNVIRYRIVCKDTGKEYYNATPAQLTAEQVAALEY